MSISGVWIGEGDSSDGFTTNKLAPESYRVDEIIEAQKPIRWEGGDCTREVLCYRGFKNGAVVKEIIVGQSTIISYDDQPTGSKPEGQDK